MQHLKDVCDVTLVSEDNKRIRGSGACEYPSRDYTMMTKKHTMILCIPKDFFSSKFLISAESMANKGYYEDFLYKILQRGKTNKIRCSFYNQGICKAGPG